MQFNNTVTDVTPFSLKHSMEDENNIPCLDTAWDTSSYELSDNCAEPPQVWSFLDAAAAIADSVKRVKTEHRESEWATPVIDQPPQLGSEVRVLHLTSHLRFRRRLT